MLTREIMMKRENEALWSQNEADMSHQRTLTSVILMITYGENMMKLTWKLIELMCLQVKLWWNMKMRLCSLKMRLICLIFELDLAYVKMHLRWKFDEANSKIERVIEFTWKIIINYENEAMWSQNEADLSHLQTWPQTFWCATMIKIWFS